MTPEGATVTSDRPTRRRMLRWLGWFAMANAVVLACVGFLYLNHFSWPSSGLAVVYLVLVYIGHHLMMAAGPLFLLVMPLIAFRPPRGLVTGWAVVVISLVIGIYVLDGLLWSQSRFHLNALTARILGWQSWVFVVVITLIALLFESLLAVRVRAWVERRARRRGGWLGSAGAAALIGAWLIYAWADASYFVPVTSIAERLPVYKGFTAKRFFTSLGLVDLERARERDLARRVSGDLSAEQSRLLDYPASPLQCENRDRHNLLIIMIDTWRFDMLSEELTPRMWAFADRRGQRFSNHYSGGNGSKSGAFSFFYGLPPGYWSSIEAVQRPAPLIEELQKQGYEMAVFSSGSLTSPVELDRSAFASIRDLHVPAPPDAMPGERDRIMLDHWLKWLDARDASGPFFSFMFFDGVTAMQAPEDYTVHFKPKGDGELAERFAGYQSAAHFVDSLVGQVLERLQANGLMDKTVILITADHGEEFDDSGAGLEKHGSGFTRYQLQVPLITAFPEREAAVYRHRTSHYDVTPTLFRHVLGCSNPPADVSVGRDLFDGRDWPWLIVGSYFNYAVIEPDRVTVTYPSGAFEVRDRDYRLIDDASVRPQILSQVMSANARFYAQ